MWLGPAPKKPYTASRCIPDGTYMIYDQSIGFLAGWGAHPLDIMVWGSDADLVGPITVEGTGKIPTTGLYDTVFNWDLVIQTPEVKMTFKPGGDSTKFIGPDGWVQVRRGGLEADPRRSWKQRSPSRSSIQSPHHAWNFVAAVKSRKPAVSDSGRSRALGRHQPTVRHRRAAEAEDHLGPEEGSGSSATPRRRR